MTAEKFVFYYQLFPRDKMMRGKPYALVRKVGVWVRLGFVWMGVNREVPSSAETPLSRPAGQVV